jgi:predicted dithiol-disulfide oxidoreductase (DUF899 family)
LEQEKSLTRARDELSRQRRQLPRVLVDKDYQFQTEHGTRTLAELFDGHGQLVVYHFMFGPEWEEGCPSCSFWTDGFSGIGVHLAHRDTSFVLVSRAPLAKLHAYQQRLGWDVNWVSSLGSDFNVDFNVSATPEQQRDGGIYNFAPAEHLEEELPGVSVFQIDAAGAVYHTYSAYSRGIDALNVTYQLLDLTPKGRDEDNLPWPVAWLRRNDSYDQG